ncbi:DUF1385 domain-containing protein [bacterium]|nr:DUF1385 domain-containing protein [bacterium]
MTEEKKIRVGGQAVIEGVMMRSPEYVATAVRKPDGRIAVKKERFISWTKRIKPLGWPFLRGGITLVESMVLGIQALNFSGEVAMVEEEKTTPEKSSKKNSELWAKITLAATVVFALGMGIGLFFYVPLLLTELVGAEGGVMFNIVDGGFRLAIFLIYLFLISRWKEIRRVFEYHGAEHVSIFAFEDDKPLTVDSASMYQTYHPRCGTSFLLVVMLVSILVFMVVGKPDSIQDRFVRLLFVPVIGGISYEIIRLSVTDWGRWIGKTFTAPGLWLQRITTQTPDEEQIEVALTALKCALGREVGDNVDFVEST